MKKIALLAGLIFVSALLSGHEFWLHPEKFIYRSGEMVNIKLMVGENYEGENWSGSRARVKSLRLYYANVIDDCADQLSETEKGDSVQVSFFEEGTMMFTFNNQNSFIELEAAKFNDYLKEDALQDAIDYRTSHNQQDTIGREYYQRSVKTLIQVGSKFTTTYKKQTNLPIDIIPQENPYKLRDGEKLPIKVLFQGKPLANAMLRIWHRNNEQTVKSELRTNEKGEAEFPVFIYGRWMISTVKMVRLDNDPKADWQSYWGSVTWGYLR
ncbi:MAG: DUF4198 domain-containing protein [Chitinophagaceae bacterium]